MSKRNTKALKTYSTAAQCNNPIVRIDRIIVATANMEKQTEAVENRQQEKKVPRGHPPPDPPYIFFL